MDKYNKVLVCRNSPQNKCYAPDGEWLVVLPTKPKMKLPKDDHPFVGVRSKEESRYGWVQSIEEGISAEELAKMYEDPPPEDLIKSSEALLKAVIRENEGTSMSCSWFERGLGKDKKRVLQVHRVFFHA